MMMVVVVGVLIENKKKVKKTRKGRGIMKK
jgi:hypothetical protein